MDKIFTHFQKLGIDTSKSADDDNLGRIKNLIQSLEKPTRILEMGGGPGAISYMVLSTFPDITLHIYEEVPEMREILDKVLADYKGRYEILHTYRLMPPLQDYDLLIVDGGKGNKERGYPKAVYLIISYLNSLCAVFIEGRREAQRFYAQQALRERFEYETIICSENKGCMELRSIRPYRNKLLKIIKTIF